MNVLIAAIGKLRGGPEKALFDQYRTRLRFSIKIVEFTSQPTRDQEGALLLSVLPSGSFIIALDENGIQLSSQEFARAWEKWKIESPSTLAFLIGGSDGLSAQVKSKAHFLWSLGRLTWPHLLVRGLLLEQLYRAQQILLGHPYHRD